MKIDNNKQFEKINFCPFLSGKLFIFFLGQGVNTKLYFNGFCLKVNIFSICQPQEKNIEVDLDLAGGKWRV